ncbi:hypothetical protein, partial [Bacillus pumilus]|uniref:hypothetical protein n=1 Tax=Bacillus pumilus TaxID=1408 RepID=UPI001C92C0D9
CLFWHWICGEFLVSERGEWGNVLKEIILWFVDVGCDVLDYVIRIWWERWSEGRRRCILRTGVKGGKTGDL